MRLVTVFAIGILACGGDDKDKAASPEPATAESKPEPTPEAPPPVEAKDAPCETLDRAECMGALHCTMHWIEDGVYECRPATGPCEVDLAQGNKPACEARDGCTWAPGNCYCQFPGYGRTQVEDKNKNTGGACACGGGEPPRCEAASAE